MYEFTEKVKVVGELQTFASGFTMMMLVSVVAVLGGFAAQSAGKENRVAQPEPFAHERRAALATDAWGGMRVDWTAVADWPTGVSPAAKAARTWIGEWLRNYRGEACKQGGNDFKNGEKQ